MHRRLAVFALTLMVAGVTSTARAHCQIPCGIYGDMLRIQMLEEHVTTIEKSVQSIRALAGKTGADDLNQLVRWIDNKDRHADEMSEIVTAYFLQQRIKAPSGDDAKATVAYREQLAVLHQLLVQSMKAKQTVDPAVVRELGALVQRFAELYLGPDDREHLSQAHE